MKRYKTEQDFMIVFKYECDAKRKWLSKQGLHIGKQAVIDGMWKRLFDGHPEAKDLIYLFAKLSPEDQVMLKLQKGQ